MPSSAMTDAPGSAANVQRPLLRLVTCGSVDDGKSTLIGRLLYDAKGIFEDQLASVEKATSRYGTTGGQIDLALLTDGLKAEREQGITIDVAYRYFSTPVRPFIIADCPGHEQYTRNMATGASTADVAILLIDARAGVVTQTRRHAYITSLLGLKHMVLAVNKMDLVGWDQKRFDGIVADFRKVAEQIGIKASWTAIPVSALLGENVTSQTGLTPWYEGPAMLEHLEGLELEEEAAEKPFRMPVQLVSRPDLNFRGYMGEPPTGRVKGGDEVVILPANIRATVARVFDADQERQALAAGTAATITLTSEIDASRGDVLADAKNPPRVANRVLANLVWFSPEAATVGGLYRLKHATRLTTATLATIRHRIDVNTLEKHSADALAMNDIALCEIESSRPLVFDPYEVSRTMGSFILIDRVTSNTVAAGMIVSEAAAQLHTGPVTAFERAQRLGQRPAIVSILGEVHRARATAIAVDRALFSSGHLSAIVDEADDLHRHAAIKALSSAGVISLVIGAASSSRHTLTASENAAGDAQKVVRMLTGGALLSAPTGDFEI